MVRTGATGAIAPVYFVKEAQIAPVGQDVLVMLAPTRCLKFLTTALCNESKPQILI